MVISFSSSTLFSPDTLGKVCLKQHSFHTFTCKPLDSCWTWKSQKNVWVFLASIAVLVVNWCTNHFSELALEVLDQWCHLLVTTMKVFMYYCKLFFQHALLISLQRKNNLFDNLAWNCLYSLYLTRFNVNKCNELSRAHKYQMFLLKNIEKPFPLCFNKLTLTNSMILNIIQ